uniref:Uncharacterized protein n=1 Tax=Oryza meridionalis TaxID=40149 RepID=A0A0E0CCM6_9ORYZ
MAGVRLVDDHLANPRLEMEGEWFTSSSGEFLLSSGRSEEYGGLSRRPSTFTRFGCCWTER